MSTLPKKVELFANIAIIVVAILLAVVLVNRYILARFPQPNAVPEVQIRPGMKLSFPDVAWEKSRKTLLLVLSTNCKYCTESAPFYQQLVARKGSRDDIRIVAVLPQKRDEAQKYLGDHGITVDQIRQAPPGAAYAKGTPTLIMVDSTGSIIESWMGKLPPEKQEEVLNHFLGEASGD
jgi:thioredoxin-related protein